MLTAGSGANNTIIGQNTASTWTVGGSGSTYNNGSNSLGIATFQTFEGGSAVDNFNVISSATASLFGGAGADMFTLADQAVLTGSIDGGAGSRHAGPGQLFDGHLCHPDLGARHRRFRRRRRGA